MRPRARNRAWQRLRAWGVAGAVRRARAARPGLHRPPTPKPAPPTCVMPFRDPAVDMILWRSVGDDTYRLLPYLFSHDELKNAVTNKIFLGFSDTTVNHLMLHKLGLPTFYGQAFLSDVCEIADINTSLFSINRPRLFDAISRKCFRREKGSEHGTCPYKTSGFFAAAKNTSVLYVHVPLARGQAFAVPFEPPGVPCSQPVSADDSAELSIRNGARRTPLAGCRMEARLPPLHALAVAPHGHRKGCAILVREEFSCLEFHMNRDTINWILKN